MLVIGSGRGHPGPIHYGLEQAVDLAGGEFFSSLDLQLEEKVEKYKPDFIIYHGSSSHLPKHAHFLKNYQTGLWFNDLRFPPLKGDYGFLKAIFICFEGKTWQKLGVPVYYMPQAAPLIDMDLVRKEEPIRWDAVFVGNVSNNKFHYGRESLIQKLSDRGIKVEVRHAPARDLRRQEVERQCRYLYKFTPFSLSWSVNTPLYTSNRTYNILAYQGFCLINHFKGIQKLFKNHKHLLWFKSNSEGVRIVKYYQKHWDKHFKIKQAGYQLFLRKHTVAHRVLNMLDILSGKTKKSYLL